MRALFYAGYLIIVLSLVSNTQPASPEKTQESSGYVLDPKWQIQYSTGDS